MNAALSTTTSSDLNGEQLKKNSFFSSSLVRVHPLNLDLISECKELFCVSHCIVVQVVAVDRECYNVCTTKRGGSSSCPEFHSCFSLSLFSHLNLFSALSSSFVFFCRSRRRQKQQPENLPSPISFFLSSPSLSLYFLPLYSGR